MRPVLVDTHTLLWIDSHPRLLSRRAAKAVRGAEIIVSSVTWYEIASLVRRCRIRHRGSVRTWLASLTREVRSVPISPAIAATAAALEGGFPEDPFDRIIYATAIEHGWALVTKDQRLLDYPAGRTVAIW